MANDRNRSDEQYSGPSGERQRDQSNEEQVRGGIGDEVRGVADEGEEEFEDMDDLEEDESDSDGSF
jgi:hypothetical protein